ncbi:MAG: DUF2254 domain-containing protein [Ramlibacter sp.]
MNGTARLWSGLRASFWFTPALIVLASMVAAVSLVEVDAWQSADLADWSPRLFGAGADGSRAMLSAIATSMITVAGVVFSITIVALSLTSTQYSPRVLRNFMSDGPTQVVLGVFLGIFTYCMVVLRTIRGGDEGVFIPSLAVLGGMAYAFLGIAVLIFFIHHVARSIQASSILLRIAEETAAAIDHLFPQELGAPRADRAGPVTLPARWQPVGAGDSGYVLSVDDDTLLAIARETGRVLRIALPVGAFVAEGRPVAAVAGPGPLDDRLARRVRACVAVGSQRTVEQDAGFGLQQLVDVALRALSPGVNDPTTACMCIDRLGALLARLARRDMPDPLRFDDGGLRVIAPAPEFGRLVGDALDPLLQHSRGDVQVLGSLLDAIETVAASTEAPQRRGTLLRRLRAVRWEAGQVRPRARVAGLRQRIAALERELAS